jgi:hypothetical protein
MKEVSIRVMHRGSDPIAVWGHILPTTLYSVPGGRRYAGALRAAKSAPTSAPDLRFDFFRQLRQREGLGQEGESIVVAETVLEGVVGVP